MPQILIPSLTSQDQHFFIEGPSAHHAFRVLRLKVGNELVLTNGQGFQCRGVLTSVDSQMLSGRGDIIEAIQSGPWKGAIHLYQGLPRGSKFDFVIEKAAEMGVASLTPFLSDKNIIKLSINDLESKCRRWNAVAESALKQCDAPVSMSINPPLQFKDVIDQLKGSFVFLLENSSRAQSSSEILKSNPLNDHVHIVVGPESGLSADEIELGLSHGFHLVRLGRRTLRTETAGLVMASILNYEWGNY